jgi:hypothetical protein
MEGGTYVLLIELALLLEDLPALERTRIQLISNEYLDRLPPDRRSQLLKVRYPLASSSSSSTSCSLLGVLSQELSFKSSHTRVAEFLFASVGEEEHDLLDHTGRVGRDGHGPFAVGAFGSVAKALGEVGDGVEAGDGSENGGRRDMLELCR